MKRTRNSIAASSVPLGAAAIRGLVVVVALAAVACAADDGDDDEEATGGDAGTAAAGTGGTPSGGGGGTGGGGATGGGGTGGGAAGSGGTGGGGDPTSVCFGATSAPESAEVSDLEDGEVTNWDIYMSTPDDASAGGTLTAPAGTHDDPPEIASEGAAGTSQSIHYAGTGWYTYGAGINFNLEGCKDLTEYTGVRFYAKGSTTPGTDQEFPPNLTENYLNFRVITAGSHGIIMEGGVNVGGDCDTSVANHGCYMPPQKNITLTPDWELYEIPFADLVTPTSAAPGSDFTGTNAMLLGWHSENGDFDFYLDEVEFY